MNHLINQIRTAIFGLMLVVACTEKERPDTYSSETLRVYQLTPKTYVHVSYLETNDFGKVPCNGLIYVNEREAVIFDTPTDDQTSEELISWVKNELNADIRAVVATHFHNDCLGGIGAFHEAGISSYGNELTLELGEKGQIEIPKYGFAEKLELKIGGSEALAVFHGEGHTSDNVIGYIPEENVLFGGCLIKSIKANKGFVGDANLNEWSNTVNTIVSTYDQVQHVVPGHGEPGGKELLDYTIELFLPEQIK